METGPTTDELKNKIQELEERLTETRKDAARIKAEASFLKDIIDNTNLPVYLKNSDYSYILVNREYERLANIEKDSIEGKTDFDIFPEPVAALFRTQDEEVKEKGSLLEFTETIPLPDGIHTFITAKFPLKDSEGEIYALGGVCTDVTELQKVEEALRNSKRKFKNIVKSCPLGIFIYELEEDNRLVLKGANPAASNILGVDCLTLIGNTIEEAFPPLADTEIPDKYRLACRDGTPWHSELVNYKDQQIEGAYTVNAFQTEPGKVAVMFEDVTHKTKVDQELHKLQKLESIGILAGGIAHDFNNLLTVIKGNISMVLASGNCSEDTTARLNNADMASSRAQNLTQQLLTFSKGGAPIKKAAHLKSLVTDSTSFTLSGSNVGSDIQFSDDLLPVLIDEGQISQVVQNLVKNADQAMPDGGNLVILGENITIDDKSGLPLEMGEYVKISIKDQGPGIPGNYLSRIFDPYFTTKEGGSGLGLAVAYSIINNHDGLLTAGSRTGNGAIFSLYLPATQSAPIDDKLLEKQYSSTSGKILVMDDEEAILMVAGDLLDHIGYDCETALDGKEAVDLYRKSFETGKPFDAVMLDLTVPGGMGGNETLKNLLEIDPDVKAIIASGYSNDPIMSDPRKHGFKGVISKPYDIEKLKEVLHKLIN